MSIQNQKPDGHNFGTFTGVFLPSILTIFGAVMFLRTNYIVGQAGITNTLIILLIASSIVFATALSISAIATNTPVYGGGVYYMISRVLGPALGGSIGIVLFFAQGLSIPFNITGFTEAIVNDYPVLQAHYSAILIGTGVVLFIIAVTGADIAIKFQYLIFITLGLGIAVAFGGAAVNFSKNLFVVNSRPAESADLIRLFAIFFPAVTGMMAGVNMSGDLKNPAKAIPAGILYANLAALLIYGLEIVLSGSGFSRPELLQTPYNVFVSHALFGMKFLVTAGVCAATISTAMGLFLCAPRVLQALARDRIIKFLNPFGKGYGKHNEPRPAAVLTFLLTAGVLIWAGKNGLDKSGISSAMNVLAQSASMFFLFTYAMINIAAFVESFGGNPSFRPRFRFFHWGVSLYGAAACIIAAFLINMLTAAGAALLMLMVFFYVKKTELEVNFGDARRGFFFSRVRSNLVKLKNTRHHAKNWRPQLVILSDDQYKNRLLVNMAALFECRKGIITLAAFQFKGECGDVFTIRENSINAMSRELNNDFPELNYETIVCNDYLSGLSVFLQTHSIGPLKPNLVLMEWPASAESKQNAVICLQTIFSLKKCLIIAGNMNDSMLLPRKNIIDIWWRGYANGSLMLILAHLLSLNPGWEKIKIRILRQAAGCIEKDTAYNELARLTEASRINAEIVIPVTNGNFADVLREYSADIDAFFLGFRRPDKNNSALPDLQLIESSLKNMPPFFLVSSSGEADLLA